MTCEKCQTNKKPTLASIALAAGASVGLLVGEHYLLSGLRVPYTYIAGVLALMAPFSVWAAFYRLWWPLATLWAVVLSGGSAVIGAYTVDWALGARAEWLAGAGLLVSALILALIGLGTAAWWLWQENQNLRAVLAVRGLEDGLGQY